MNVRTLRAGKLPRQERRGRIERHLLALTGGGYRGLFSATVLKRLEQDSVAPLADRFDMIAGTSIGGILAIGLACGVRCEDLAALVQEHGPSIFQAKPRTFKGLAGARYGQGGLERAIIAVIGKPAANRPFREIPAPLVVCAVDELTSAPRLFRTAMVVGSARDDTSTLDVALATAAAPTYFPPHRIAGRAYVDGGLIANAPDAVLLTEAMRSYGSTLAECHLLSVGTAGSPRLGAVTEAPGKVGWVAKHALVDLIMSAQEGLAMSQVEALHPGTFLRLDQQPPEPIRLDDTSQPTGSLLIALGEGAYEQAKTNRHEDLRRFLSHMAVR